MFIQVMVLKIRGNAVFFLLIANCNLWWQVRSLLPTGGHPSHHTPHHNTPYHIPHSNPHIPTIQFTSHHSTFLNNNFHYSKSPIQFYQNRPTHPSLSYIIHYYHYSYHHFYFHKYYNYLFLSISYYLMLFIYTLLLQQIKYSFIIPKFKFNA